MIALLSCGSDEQQFGYKLNSGKVIMLPKAQYDYITKMDSLQKTLPPVPPNPRFKVGNKTYEILTGSDSCQYYYMKMAPGNGEWEQETQYFHYSQCSYCKKHK